jgi:hypothetical protein
MSHFPKKGEELSFVQSLELANQIYPDPENPFSGIFNCLIGT